MTELTADMKSSNGIFKVLLLVITLSLSHGILGDPKVGVKKSSHKFICKVLVQIFFARRYKYLFGPIPAKILLQKMLYDDSEQTD